MADNGLSELISYLEHTNEEVKRIEAEGEAILAAGGGQDAFQARLREKAELLAGLSESTRELVEPIPGELGEKVARRMRRFSKSAGMALRIGSVFFMTALLYPEKYKPGEPNDLEAYIAELKAR